MTNSELRRILTSHGFWLVNHGHRHDRYCDASGTYVIVPRHGKSHDVPAGTVKAILKKAGIR